jgi:itaconate CoA-transferase
MATAYQDLYESKRRTAAEAVAAMADGETMAVGMAVGQPPALPGAVAERLRAGDLKRLTVHFEIAMAPMAETLLSPDVLPHVDARTFFVASPDHQIIKAQAADHLKQARALIGIARPDFRDELRAAARRVTLI